MEKTQCLIIGGGPAGLSAAIYTSRANLDTLVVGCDPKIAGDYSIDNYFGFEESITGRELIERGRKQAARFGAKVECDKVLGVHHGENGGFVIKTEKREVEACAVILATGVSRAKPRIEGLDAFEGKGVSYCVSCDGFFYRGRPVIVAGEGVFAANQALELSNFSKDVSICTMGKEPTFSPQFAARLEEEGVRVLNSVIVSLSGDKALSQARFKDGSTAQVDGLFIAMGEASSSDFAKTLGLEQNGNFISVDREMKTNIPGVFAAGDCTGGYLQISVSVGEGALAARSAINHVKDVCRKK
ncbi:NAD(P)/FAD-dependent oxidoreductase [Fundidesulfovibrio butyratiphilus]